MVRRSFSIHSDYYEELRNLSQEERGDVFLALLNWASDRDAEVPELEHESAMLFRLMTAQIARISKTYSSNGAKGGAKEGNQNAVKTSKTSKTSKPYMTTEKLTGKIHHLKHTTYVLCTKRERYEYVRTLKLV